MSVSSRWHDVIYIKWARLGEWYWV